RSHSRRRRNNRQADTQSRRLHQKGQRDRWHRNEIKGVSQPVATLFGTVFKLRKLNVISFIVSTLGEAGIKNIYPVLKGTFEYVGDMNDIARRVLKYYGREQKATFE